MKYNDGMGHRSRRAFCLLLGPGDRAQFFAGDSIPGIVASRVLAYEKKGRWSNSTYELSLGEGVRALTGHSHWETGLVTDTLAELAAVSNTLPAISAGLGIAPATLLAALEDFGSPASIEAMLESIRPVLAAPVAPAPALDPDGPMALALRKAGLL